LFLLYRFCLRTRHAVSLHYRCNLRVFNLFARFRLRLLCKVFLPVWNFARTSQSEHGNSPRRVFPLRGCLLRGCFHLSLPSSFVIRFSMFTFAPVRAAFLLYHM